MLGSLGGGSVKEEKARLRRLIWDKLVELNLALPPPPHGRIPNFKGADVAAGILAGVREWREARVVKVNPDSPQRWVRLRALNEGKLLLMPTPRLREGFLLLDPRRIPRSLYDRASTIRGAFELGVKLRSIEDLVSAIRRVDFIVEGSVVVNTCGERLGKGEGYGELEYAILLELNLIDPNVAIATTVHEIQVVEGRIPQDPYDVPVDIIVTPTRVMRVQRCRGRPPGVLWDLLDERKLREIPILRELKAYIKR